MGVSSLARELLIRWGPIPGTAQEQFFDDDTPDGYLLFTGGWGSGKSMTLMGKMLKLSAINAPLPGIWCVPDYEHIHDTILPLLADSDPDTGDPWFLDPSQYHYTDTHKALTWDGGGPIWFKTAENAKTIAGPNVAFCGTDEPGSVKREAWRNTVARVRHPSAKLRQKVGAGTPEGLNYLTDLFGPDRDEGYKVYRMKTTENTELLRHNPGYIQQVMAGATDAELASYLEGKFVNLSGALAYPAFDADKQYRPFELSSDLPLRLAFDFNVDPMALIIGQQWAGPAGTEFGAHTALALPSSTVMDVCAEFVKRFPKWRAGLWIYGDATGKRRSHQSLRSNYDVIRELLAPVGPLTFKVPDANPPVSRRVNSVNVLCRDAREVCRFWLNGDAQKPRSSPVRELVRSLQQTKKKPGTDDIWKQPGETVSHLADALGYWLTHEAPAEKPIVKAGTMHADWLV